MKSEKAERIVVSNAKFKVGDKVRDIRYGGRYEAKIMKVVPGRGMTMYTLDAPVSSNPSMRVTAV